ncbi:26329_t:CDS:2 [Gigaspora margarita]|uniref:26329_t:CDS:1 n=1 Tax=Gigaspora margarita TaxID=4874 RepID=A0ABM8W4K4_GIGMA|nr:26329_t:CDS:2 [Gigaspora margarita]
MYASPIHDSPSLDSNSLEFYEAEAQNFLNAQDSNDSNNASEFVIFNKNSFIVTLKKFNTDFVAVAKFDASIVSRGVMCPFIINAFVVSVGVGLIAALAASSLPLTIGTYTLAGPALGFAVAYATQSINALADLIIRTACYNESLKK